MDIVLIGWVILQVIPSVKNFMKITLTKGLKPCIIAVMIVTPSKFALIIEGYVKDKNLNYMDAVVLYCEENNIDPSNIKPLVNKHLKEKIAYEAQ
ncbi:uncharacterized protein METZ01_LOCUS316531, partial [marine metagenome]